ncbi:bifunctional 3-(3-hydroxy-phenyl)propionate/3-hydroxycinnamic acid hydroxylase [Streptomyces hoynatensis]|uniref:Bifunctional 3-(3-hydroxy-phenyl)propionate/3-hydroxycinnamic acid hydroxylase n=1 Tax=Streptomyces hoynatensis TaxID=1141874 RepID=A0A3A9YZP9_9ACTN|nr:bifunctional 3-(3-hydroxy-phenyl)propionate/3-hydroxycinnamic acid hydroxylase [Streptomyces hoynatensis]RKN41164.1 bifunctional 3-(3-hydroxy-phenyl)propionate/3-hydroxycinnamic acid hydroxylase [Streptomyces hoynatensis]
MAAATDRAQSATETDADVVIIGNGPTGQTLSLLLARRGWRVIVLERYPGAYELPRVKGFDGETARNFAAAGIAEQLPGIIERLGEYEFRNAAGQALIRFELPFEPGWDGWPPAVVIHQPTLEATLDAQARTLPTLRVLRGHRALRVSEHPGHVEISAPGPTPGVEKVTASWLVGCDGANSFVRDCLGGKMIDMGYKQEWLLVDLKFHEPRVFDPNDRQICDPMRPTTMVASGRGHRRWEFRRLPGETAAELTRPEAAWRLLAPYGATPENSTIARQVMYTFQAAISDTWRSGRMLIAGDAAHLMPPFAGQGMCSGIRDAANLAWKLDLVLRGVSDEALLDTYAAERDPHVREAIGFSVQMGQLISELDTVRAAQRDAQLLAAQAAPQEGAPPLAGPPPEGQAEPGAAPSDFRFAVGEGVLRRNERGEPVPLAGARSPQGRVARGEESGLFDDVVGRGFVLLATFDPRAALSAEELAFLERIGARVVRVLHADTAPEKAREHEVVDVDNVYLPYLADAGQVAALVRPDFYVFGTAWDRADLSGLVGALREQLAAEPVPAAG